MIRAIARYNHRNKAIATNHFSRILTTTIASRDFRNKLHADPLHIVRNGFIHQEFILSKERTRLSEIKAGNLADLTLQLTQNGSHVLKEQQRQYL